MSGCHAGGYAATVLDGRLPTLTTPLPADRVPLMPGDGRPLREMARVGRRHLVLSVPREPIFRCCNLVAGRYVRDLGNTPGHLNHWSRGGFIRFVSQVAEVREVTSPFPWTCVWATLPG